MTLTADGEIVANRSKMAEMPRVIGACYDRRTKRILVLLSNRLEVAVPIELAHGLDGESASDLEDIEISPAGLVLHWPQLDTDLYVPDLLKRVFGTLQGRWLAYWSGWPNRPPRPNGR